MAYPKITLTVANEFFDSVGILIRQVLGHYEADVNGVVHSNVRLGDLVNELMITYFHVPEQQQSLDAPGQETPSANHEALFSG